VAVSTLTRTDNASVCRLALGTLGLPRRDLRKVYAFRRMVEDQAVREIGGVTTAGASLIHSACCYLAEAYDAQAKREKAKTLDEDLRLSECITRNIAGKDRALAALGLTAVREESDDDRTERLLRGQLGEVEYHRLLNSPAPAPPEIQAEPRPNKETDPEAVRLENGAVRGVNAAGPTGTPEADPADDLGDIGTGSTTPRLGSPNEWGEP
jgi:hypothetical protein